MERFETNRKLGMIRPVINDSAKADYRDALVIVMMTEMVLTGEVQRYGSLMKIYAQENNMYRQRIKKELGVMEQSAMSLQKEFSVFERGSSIESIADSFDIYVQDYYDSGEAVGKSVQAHYEKTSKSLVQKIYLSYKNIFDKHSVAHSDAVAYLFTIIRLTMIGRDVSKTMFAVRDRIEKGYITGRYEYSRMLDKIENAARNVLHEVVHGATFQCVESEFSSVEGFACKFVEQMVYGYPISNYVNVIAEQMYRYIDYCLVRLWMSAHNGVSDKEYAALVDLGVDAEALLAQLRSMPLPEGEVWDIHEHLPKKTEFEGTPIADFLARCRSRAKYLKEIADLAETKAKESKKENANNIEKNTLN